MPGAACSCGSGKFTLALMPWMLRAAVSYALAASSAVSKVPAVKAKSKPVSKQQGRVGRWQGWRYRNKNGRNRAQASASTVLQVQHPASARYVHCRNNHSLHPRRLLHTSTSQPTRLCSTHPASVACPSACPGSLRPRRPRGAGARLGTGCGPWAPPFHSSRHLRMANGRQSDFLSHHIIYIPDEQRIINIGRRSVYPDAIKTRRPTGVGLQQRQHQASAIRLQFMQPGIGKYPFCRTIQPL